jgi:ABC-type Fe3+ transport system substrate-binding protein
MEKLQIDAEMTVFDVTERYPATVQVLVDAGFPKMRDPDRRRSQGRALKLGAAAKLRRMAPQELIDRLLAAARSEAEAQDVTLTRGSEVDLLPAGDVRLSGLLPCPVRIPILEHVSELAGRMRQQQGLELGWSLAAAAVGADGLTAQLARAKEEQDLPEIFVSAGFESFFDHRALRRFKDRFVDLAPNEVNPDFEGLGLRDPEGHFTLLGVVPAVFLVNGPQLGDDPEPRSWEDLLSERFAGRVALPVSDFDLFNGMLLSLHSRFGERGIADLARSMVASMHPSQTVGRFAGKSEVQPAVSIVPYFFSRMTMGAKTVRVVWPEDGAIVCPIFMLVRKSALPAARPVADLLLSREVGEVLAHRGLFPVLHPEVDNRLPEGARFAWLGWDYIQQHDLGELIPRLNELFQQGLAAQEASA